MSGKSLQPPDANRLEEIPSQNLLTHGNVSDFRPLCFADAPALSFKDRKLYESAVPRRYVAALGLKRGIAHSYWTITVEHVLLNSNAMDVKKAQVVDDQYQRRYFSENLQLTLIAVG